MNSLIFGFLSLGVASAPLPSVDQVQQEVKQFEAVFGLSGTRIQVRKIEKNHPSPLFASAKRWSCDVSVNQSREANKTWSYLVSQSGVSQPVYQSFAIGHELSHCLMGKLEVRKRVRASLERKLGLTFKSRIHFEEALGDMVGLSYAAQMHPQHATRLIAAVKAVREDFSSRDKDHDTADLLNLKTMYVAKKLVTQPSEKVALNN